MDTFFTVTQTKFAGAAQGSTRSSYVATAWSTDKGRARPSYRHLREKFWKSHISAKPCKKVYGSLSPCSNQATHPTHFTPPTELSHGFLHAVMNQHSLKFKIQFYCKFTELFRCSGVHIHSNIQHS